MRAKAGKGAKSQLKREFADIDAFQRMLGVHDENIHLLESVFDVEIAARGENLIIKGSKKNVDLANKSLSQMYELAEDNFNLTLKDVEQITKFVDVKSGEKMSDLLKYPINVPAHGKTIAPCSPAQREYVEAIRNHDMIFSIGPAGTGKTYLAMAMAVNALVSKQYDRIILTRPAVEAGEKLGFLPGSMQEKVNPYLRPLYDALHDMMDIEQVHRYLDQAVIEVAPLAFMRGRTLNSSFVILDEAQNCTKEQMKMFLTRMGFDSKYVVTGDVTQIDLPTHAPSGLMEARRILEGIEGIHFQYFSEVDVVRHRLVRQIVKAYERNGSNREKGEN
jgi:phosphate starvation-inducible PhoH-like protein